MKVYKTYIDKVIIWPMLYNANQTAMRLHVYNRNIKQEHYVVGVAFTER